MKSKIVMLFNFWTLVLKIYIFEVAFYLSNCLSSQLSFLVVFCIYNIHVFNEAFSPLSNRFYDNWKNVFFLFPRCNHYLCAITKITDLINTVKVHQRNFFFNFCHHFLLCNRVPLICCLLCLIFLKFS